jgi:hypothetical protein
MLRGALEADVTLLFSGGHHAGLAAVKDAVRAGKRKPW